MGIGICHSPEFSRCGEDVWGQWWILGLKIRRHPGDFWVWCWEIEIDQKIVWWTYASCWKWQFDGIPSFGLVFYHYCLVVWNIFYFPIYWECHHPNRLIFFGGVKKPPTRLQFIVFQDSWLQPHLHPPLRDIIDWAWHWKSVHAQASTFVQLLVLGGHLCWWIYPTFHAKIV